MGSASTGQWLQLTLAPEPQPLSCWPRAAGVDGDYCRHGVLPSCAQPLLKLKHTQVLTCPARYIENNLQGTGTY